MTFGENNLSCALLAWKENKNRICFFFFFKSSILHSIDSAHTPKMKFKLTGRSFDTLEEIQRASQQSARRQTWT